MKYQYYLEYRPILSTIPPFSYTSGFFEDEPSVRKGLFDHMDLLKEQGNEIVSAEYVAITTVVEWREV